MILFGSFLIWITTVWILRSWIFKAIDQFHQKDQKRLTLLQDQLHQNFIFREKNKIQAISRWFLFSGALLSLFLHSLLFLSFILIAYVIFPCCWIRIIEILRKNKFQKQLLLFIPSLSSMLKSGHGLERAMNQLKDSFDPPISDEIHLILKEMQLGTPLEKALQKMAQRFQSENMLMLVHAIVISRKLGTSLSEAMDHIAKNVLEKEKLRQQIGALTSQGKMQAWIAVAMPFLMGIILNILSPEYFQPLFGTFVGLCCLFYCFISMSIGLVWIHRITHKEYL